MRAIVNGGYLVSILDDDTIAPHAVEVQNELRITNADIGYQKYIVVEGKIAINPDYVDTSKADALRVRRERECFAICDRAVWFFLLTEEQKRTIIAWRQAWLDAPQTRIVPEKPDFIN